MDFMALCSNTELCSLPKTSDCYWAEAKEVWDATVGEVVPDLSLRRPGAAGYGGTEEELSQAAWAEAQKLKQRDVMQVGGVWDGVWRYDMVYYW